MGLPPGQLCWSVLLYVRTMDNRLAEGGEEPEISSRFTSCLLGARVRAEVFSVPGGIQGLPLDLFLSEC